MALGSRLKELRLRRGESLQQVADAVGASKAHVWELERGTSKNPSLDLLKGFAEHFKVTVASLIGEVPENDDELLVLYRDMQNLNEEDRKTVQVVIDDFKRRKKEK